MYTLLVLSAGVLLSTTLIYSVAQIVHLLDMCAKLKCRSGSKDKIEIETLAFTVPQIRQIRSYLNHSTV